MNRIALFAHYDRDGVIDDYVLYYLRELRSIAQRTLLVSDCELRSEEKAKLDGVAELVSAERHGEYDFGSWKRAFAFLGDEIGDWDEVVIANDSCFAPIYPFDDVFARMDARDCDFWSPSATDIDGTLDHLSSYFQVFRRPVLRDPAFREFWPTIGPQPNVEAVVEHYEKGLTQILLRRGYRWSALTPPGEIGAFLKTAYLAETLHAYRSAWLKTRIVRHNPFFATNIPKHLGRTQTLYPRRLIDAHLTRVLGTNEPRHYRRRFVGNYRRALGRNLAIESTVRVNHANMRAWWRVHLVFRGLRFFAFTLPIGKTPNARF